MNGSSGRFVATSDALFSAVPDQGLVSLAGSRVLVTGHGGKLGRALVRRLAREDCEVVGVAHHDLDLTDHRRTARWFRDMRPDFAILAAGVTGGILAHQDARGAMVAENCGIALSTLAAADAAGTRRAIWVSSSAIYPSQAGHALNEADVLTGPPDTAHRGYALAKLVGMELADRISLELGRDYSSAICTNLYGAIDPRVGVSGNVIASLFARFQAAVDQGAETVTVWGSGRPRRDFLHVDDCADALVTIFTRALHGWVNVGSGADISIADLSALIAELTGFSGTIHFDASRPDGAQRKLLDISRLSGLGWSPAIPLRAGLQAYIRSLD